jgi:DNA polymerase epsilon subunit 1
VDAALEFAILKEGKIALDDIANYDEIKSQIVDALVNLRDTPTRLERPLIYHLDVAAMYPNIILTNRLQSPALVNEATCAACDFYKPGADCQRNLSWQWRGEYWPTDRGEYNMIQAQLVFRLVIL